MLLVEEHYFMHAKYQRKFSRPMPSKLPGKDGVPSPDLLIPVRILRP
jgi:hypothetical protein